MAEKADEQVPRVATRHDAHVDRRAIERWEGEGGRSLGTSQRAGPDDDSSGERERPPRRQ